MKFKSFWLKSAVMLLGISYYAAPQAKALGEEVPVFITIGQSNADGSAFFDEVEDARLNTWYTSSSNPGNMKIWYRSAQVQNQNPNAMGEIARWCVDGASSDVQPGWLNLWYRNDNLNGRTAMNMIHDYGTYSTGTGVDCAQGRRGMEGQFGVKFAEQFPGKELYVVKLGVSGSAISTWSDAADNHNWDYFYNYMFKPAISDLLARGKRPVLAGIWWMQGCGDNASTQEHYRQCLEDLIAKCRADLGFERAPFYIGHILAPGENDNYPEGSTQYSANVRNAQDEVAADMDGVEIVDTHDCTMQYEENFSGYLHYDHAGQNLIADKLVAKIADTSTWSHFTTPGRWMRQGSAAVFVPSIGCPEITYTVNGDVVSANLSFPGFTETKSVRLSELPVALGPGYLDCDGSRYMTIPHHSDFDKAAGTSLTISAKVWLNSYGAHRGILCNRWHAGTSNSATCGFDLFGGNSAANSYSINVNMNTGSWNNLGFGWQTTLGTGQWAVLTWVLDGTAGTAKLYKDGVLAETKTNSNISNYPLNPQCDILVGARYTVTDGQTSSVDATSYWLGKITDVRIFSKALTQEEVTNNMTASVADMADGLIAAYDFEQIQGLTVTDISGHGHDGTLVGFPSYVDGEPLTITQTTGGTVHVYNGTEEVHSGQNIENGTQLRVEAVADQDYTLQQITVNGEPLEGDSFTFEGATQVSATFARNADAPTKVLVWDMGDEGSQYWRIPALLTAADGSLVAIADRRGSSLGDLPNTISVVSKRSTDGGQTWSESTVIAQGDSNTGKTYGDAAAVVDRNTGNIIVMFSGDQGFFASTKTNRAGFYVSKSTDNGVTWSEPRNVSDQIYSSSWYGAFVASGRMLQTADGRIMAVANTRYSSQWALVDVYEHVICSSDGGDTWSVLNPTSRIPAAGNGNESKLVECANGDLIMSIRSEGNRRFSRSTDGGVTWSAAASVTDLVEPGCNGDIIMYPSADGQSRMLHILPNNSSVRRDVSVFMSYDEGATWPIKKKLIDGVSAYASLTVLPDGSVGALIEEGKWDSNLPGEDGFRLYYMNFTLDWLTDGADTPDQPGDGVFDGTLNCDGTRYMRIPHFDGLDIPAGGSFTVSAKVKLDEFGTYRGIVNNRSYEGTSNAGTTGFDIFVGQQQSQGIGNNVNTYTGSWNNVGNSYFTGLQPGQWATVAWVLDGTSGTTTMYLDGVEKTTRQSDNYKNYPTNPQFDMLVGARYTNVNGQACTVSPDQNWLGNIDDVRIYNRALTASEVAGDITTVAEGLVCAYDFSEVRGYEVTDISGNGHNGILVGFPENAEGHALTIEAPEARYGTLEVYNGETRLVNGRKVPHGTELNVVATPVEGWITENIFVNGTAIEGATFVMNEDATVSVAFARDPDAPLLYCVPTGKTSCNYRYVNSLRFSDDKGNTTDITAQGNGADRTYMDHTSEVFTTAPGATVTMQFIGGTGEWMHSYLFVDFGRDGEFDVDASRTTPNGDLVTFDRYCGTGSTYYDASGRSYTDGHTMLASNTIPSFTLPDDMVPGDYRVRYRMDWNNVDACSTLNDEGNTVGRACVDFTLRVESENYENSRIVQVLVNDDALGTVEFVAPAEGIDQEQHLVDTSLKNVTFRAVASEGSVFMHWLDADGNNVGTDSEYTYSGTEDAVFTAVFGHSLQLLSNDGGTLTATLSDGAAVVSGSVFVPGTEIILSPVAADGYHLSALQINDTDVEVDDNGTYTLTLEANTVARATFAERTYLLTLLTQGNGEAYVAVEDEFDFDTFQSDNKIVDGSDLMFDTGYILCVTPGTGETITAIVVETGDYVSEYGVDDADDSLNGSFIYPFLSAGDTQISVTFTDNAAAIGSILLDSENGPVRYYNMMGVEVTPTDMVTGYYIVSRGNKTLKVFIRR